MAEGYEPIYAEKDKVLSNEFLKIISKSTTSSSGTVVFTNSVDRYVAILLIISNSGYSSIYAIGTKISTTDGNFITKLAGANFGITVDSSGSISVPLQGWSVCTVLSSIQFT